MPNKRSKNKAYLGGYVDRKLLAKLTRLAKTAGMQKNKFGFAAKLIEESLNRRNQKQRSRARKSSSPKA